MSDDNVIPIGFVPLPTVAEEAQAAVIEKLERALLDARAGMLDAVLIVGRRPNSDDWKHWSSCMIATPQFIGMVEVAKVTMIHDYAAQCTMDTSEDEPPDAG